MFIMLIKYKDHRMNMFTNSSKERRIYGRLYSSSSIRELRVVIRERERGLKVMTVYSTCTLLQIGPTKSLYGSWLVYTSISISLTYAVALPFPSWLSCVRSSTHAPHRCCSPPPHRYPYHYQRYHCRYVCAFGISSFSTYCK